MGFSRYFNEDFKSFTDFQEMKNNRIQRVRQELIIKISNLPAKARLKSLFTLMFSLLQLCDDYSSAHFSEFVKQNKEQIIDTLGPVLSSPDRFVQCLNNLSPEQILADNDPYGFQSEVMEKARKFCIISAPCGRGKSEAALLWAQRVCQNTRRNKIIFALPTQITSNAMRKRLIRLFGREAVGLFHGKSFVKLKNERELEQSQSGEFVELGKEDLDELKEENFKGNIYFHPVTVTTVDHLVYSFIHGHSQADFALGQIQNSVVIFDEVHYYQGNTVKHLLVLFSILKELDIPHLLMSGTLPQPVLERALAINPTFELITDQEGQDFTPFRIEYLKSENLITKNDGANERIIEEIVENYRQGLNQFIILNTVRRAQDFYCALKDRDENLSLMLHHSQFVYKHRIEKEDEIYLRIEEKPFILVSSQVIEISLNISCDVMYTELAPIDALGQRGGRLNRGGKIYRNENKEFIMKVFEPEQDVPYRYDEDKIDFMSRTREILEDGVYSYRRIKALCDKVYEGIELDSRLLKNIFNECTLFGRRPAEITWDGAGEDGKGFKFREINYQKVEVMPDVLYLADGSKNKAENLGSVPLWWLKVSEDRKDGYFIPISRRIGDKREVFDFWLCKLPYSIECGFEYLDDAEMRGVIL
jgi:CRISPR-associated endonuclease/helicase Cas3